MSGRPRTPSGRFTGESFDPSLTAFTLEWWGIEVDPATPMPPPWPVVWDGPMRAPTRVFRVDRLAVRLGGEPAYLVGENWRPYRGWAIAMRGLTGSGQFAVNTAGPRRLLNDGLRLMALVGPARGRPDETKERIDAIVEAYRAVRRANPLRVESRCAWYRRSEVERRAIRATSKSMGSRAGTRRPLISCIVK
jgi:hypothetical protein